MTLLCSFSVGQAIAVALKEKSTSEDILREQAEAVECMKEVVTQVTISPEYREQAATLQFVQHCLVTIRALLLGWDPTPSIIAAAPLSRIAELEGGAMWKITHPNRARFHSEVKASIQFMESNAMTLHGEPWIWLLSYLKILDYNLL